MPAATATCCGFYYLRGSQNWAQPRQSLGGYGAPGSRSVPAVVRSPRFLGLRLVGIYHRMSRARTTVSAITDFGPSLAALCHNASRMAPLINTWSTSKTRGLSTSLLGGVAKAPRPDASRSSCFVGSLRRLGWRPRPDGASFPWRTRGWRSGQPGPIHERARLG
jgi:hypothetical protein